MSARPALYRFMCTAEGDFPSSWLVLAADDSDAMTKGFALYPEPVFDALNAMWGVTDDEEGAFYTTEAVQPRFAGQPKADALEDLAYQLSTVVGLETLPWAYHQAMAQGLYTYLVQSTNTR